jgi:hypothetical protein
MQAMRRWQQDMPVWGHATNKVCNHLLARCWSLTTSRQDKILERLEEIMKAVFHEVNVVSRTLTGTSIRLQELVAPRLLLPKPLEISQETHEKLFSFKRLQELSEAYIRNGHVLCPIFDAPRKMCDEFIKEYSDAATVRRRSIMPYLHNANVLLFLALGSFTSISDGSRDPSNLLGMAYYSYAHGILARERGEYSVAVAQTMTLAALYFNHSGMLRQSWTNISCAYGIFMDLGY